MKFYSVEYMNSYKSDSQYIRDNKEPRHRLIVPAENVDEAVCVFYGCLEIMNGDDKRSKLVGDIKECIGINIINHQDGSREVNPIFGLGVF